MGAENPRSPASPGSPGIGMFLLFNEVIPLGRFLLSAPRTLDLDRKDEVRCYCWSCDSLTGCSSYHLVRRYTYWLLLRGYIADEMVSR